MAMTPNLLFEIPRGLDNSILLAVLVGFVVMLVFTELFGWVFVGVVVPGYLASVLVIQPAAGLAVLLDSSLTYLVAKFFEQVLGRGGASSAFFGRERFFLLVLVAVFVRQHTQSWLWPMAMQNVDPVFDLSPGFQRGFSSIGLVLVPLIANLMWKLDLRRGSWQLFVTTGITYALLAWWLLPQTTLSYSAIELSYEDTAIDFLGNAKIYIVFLTTAYIASQLNLYYGWDFNGILVPALTGLLWFYPSKLVTTLIESALLYWVAIRLPTLPVLRRVNLEGPRRLALVFTFGVILKWIVGAALGDRFPMIKITDLYGFGYLLPSLLALKMMKRKSIRAVALPTLVASLGGFVLGSLIGFALSFTSPPPRSDPARARNRNPVEVPISTRLIGRPSSVGVLGHLHALEDARALPDHGHIVAYRRAWTALSHWLDHPGPGSLAEALETLERLDLELVRLQDDEAARPHFALLEPEEPGAVRRGWDTALLSPGAPGPVLLVPRPVSEAPIAEASAELCRRLACRALLIAGRDRPEGAWTELGTTTYEVALGALRAFPLLELRADATASAGHPTLHLGSDLPDAFDLRRLWEGRVELSWLEPELEASELPARGGVLRIHPTDLDGLLAASAPVLRSAPRLPPWLARRTPDPLAPSMDPSSPPSRFESRDLQSFVVEPLVEIAGGHRPSTELDRIVWHAHQLDLEIWRFEDCGGGRGCLAVVDPRLRDGMGWGALLVRAGDARPIAIEVPRPGRAFGTHQLGLELWWHTRGRAVYIGPSDDTSERNDPLSVGNVHAPLLPFHQALDRTLGPDLSPPPLIVQVLGFGSNRPIDTELVVGLGRPVLEQRQLPDRLESLLRGGALGWVDNPIPSDGSPLLHGLAGLGTPAVEYSLELGRSETAILWFSPSLRSRYVGRAYGEERRRAAALGLAMDVRSELEALGLRTGRPPVGAEPARLDPAAEAEFVPMLAEAIAYAENHDINRLRRLLSLEPTRGQLEVELGHGSLTALPFLVLRYTTSDARRWALVLLDEARPSSLFVQGELPGASRMVELALFRRERAIVVTAPRPEEVTP